MDKLDKLDKEMKEMGFMRCEAKDSATRESSPAPDGGVNSSRKPYSELRLPVVHGRRSSLSNDDFERACLVHIDRLQWGRGPLDSAMMATFREAVRMVREYSDVREMLANGWMVTRPNAGAVPRRSDVGASPLLGVPNGGGE